MLAVGPRKAVAPLLDAGLPLAVAEGQADLYPRLAPTCEWDTAAAHAVVVAAGGRVTDLDGQPLQYTKSDILNPYFMVDGTQTLDWQSAWSGVNG